MKRALVTGAFGFLGGYLQPNLRRLGCEVVPVGRGEISSADDPACWRQLLENVRPTIVFHLLGATHAANEAAFDEIHLQPTRALLSAAEDLRMQQMPIVVIGSAAEYGEIPAARQPIAEDEPARPISAYGRSKLRATETALEFAARGMDVAVVRLFNVFGWGMSDHMMPGAILAQFRKNPARIEVGSLDRVRDFLHANVAMDALAQLALRKFPRGEVVNLCSGRGWNLRAIVEAMAAAIGFSGEIVESRGDSSLSPGVHSCVGDCTRLKAILGYQPAAPTLEDFAQMARDFSPQKN